MSDGVWRSIRRYTVWQKKSFFTSSFVKSYVRFFVGILLFCIYVCDAIMKTVTLLPPFCSISLLLARIFLDLTTFVFMSMLQSPVFHWLLPSNSLRPACLFSMHQRMEPPFGYVVVVVGMGSFTKIRVQESLLEILPDLLGKPRKECFNIPNLSPQHNFVPNGTIVDNPYVSVVRRNEAAFIGPCI